MLTSLARTERATQLSQEVYLRAQSRVQREILFFSTQAVHFYICGKCDSIEEGVKTAAEMIDSGKALKKA